MKKKILASVLAALAVAGALTACGGSSSTPAAPSTSGDGDSSSPEYVWKMALNSTEGDNAYDTAAVFKDKIAELTDGRVQVDLYGGAQLGSTTEVLEGMSVGVADIMCESVGTLAPFTPLANIDIMPYMYTGYDHFMNVWNSDLGDEIKETVGEAAGWAPPTAAPVSSLQPRKCTPWLTSAASSCALPTWKATSRSGSGWAPLPPLWL